MITVKNLGWLGYKHGSTYELDHTVIKDTDQLISYIDLVSKDFKLNLKQMFFNGVSYVVYIDGTPYNIAEVLKNAITLSDSVLVEFVPYFKFNAGFYEGIGSKELIKDGPISLVVPFTSHFFSWLRSNPIKLDDNEPYKEIFKKRSDDYKKIIADMYAPKSKGDLLNSNNAISYGESIPLAYGTVKYSGRNIANNVVTNIMPTMSPVQLNQLEQIYLDSNRMFYHQNGKLGDVPDNWDATLAQLKQNYKVELDTSAIARGLKNYGDYLNMFTNRNLNMIVTVKDPNNTDVAYDSTEALRIDSKSGGKAVLDFVRNIFSSNKHHAARAEHFYDDEGGAVLFFYMYKDLVVEADKKFKDLIVSVSSNENNLKTLFSDDNKFNAYKVRVNYLDRLTRDIFTYAKSVYNLADAANGQGGHLGKITDICQILLKVFGKDYVNQYLQKPEISTWWIVKHGGINYIDDRSKWDGNTIQNTNGTGNLRGELFDYIDKLITLKF